MKKVYVLLTLATLGVLALQAQVAKKITETGKNTVAKKNMNAAVARHSSPSSTNMPSTVIWFDEFDTPSNWVIDHEPGTVGDWVINPYPPAGLYPIDPINSASSVNGFARFDSDSICSHNQIANLTTANSIDLSAYPAVRLSFSQYYRRYHDSTYVFVSNDSVNWTKFEVNGNLLANEFSANDDPNVNPEIVNINITSVAGGQATVWIRFQFYSPDTNASGADTSAGCAYAWMIDDVSISDIPATDGSVMRAFAGEYSVIPIIQPEAFKIRGRIINTGTAPWSGAKLMFNVYGLNAGLLYSDSSIATGTINPGDTSNMLSAIGTYTPVTVDTFFVEQILSLSGDGEMSNDTSIAIILVNDSMYARDNIVVNPASFIGGYGFNNASGSMGQIFHIDHASAFTSATFFLGNPPVGDHVSVSVYTVTSGVPGTMIGSSPVYTLQAGDTLFTTIAFSAPVVVNPGDYFVCINQLDTTNMSLGFSSEIYTPASAFAKVTASAIWSRIDGATGNGLRAQLLLRVNNPSGTLVGVAEAKEKAAFMVFPNPSAGYIYVAGNGTPQNDVTVTIFNSIGQVAKTLHYDALSINRIDLSDLNKGMYTVQVSSPAGNISKSIILN